MKREELENMFPCGTIQEELHNSSVMIWGFQLVYAAIAAWGLYRGVLLYRELGHSFNMWMLLLMVVSAYALLRMYQQDDVEIYIATEGLILKRTPILVKERIERFFCTRLIFDLCSLSRHHGIWRRLENLVCANRNGRYIYRAY